MKTPYLLLSLFVMLISCRKNEQRDPLILSGAYETINTITVERPVMYIKDKKITDSSIINTYLRHYNFLDSFTYSRTETLNITMLKLKIGNNDSVQFNLKEPSRFSFGDSLFNAKKILLPDNEILIKRTDSSVHFTYINPPGQINCQDSTTSVLKSYPLSYKYQYDYYANSVTQVQFGGFPLTYKNGTLALNLYTIYSNGKCSNASGSMEWEMGIKNTRGIKRKDLGENMQATDTIVMQEKYLPLKKIR